MSKKILFKMTGRGAIRVLAMLLIIIFVCGFAAPAAFAGSPEPADPDEVLNTTHEENDQESEENVDKNVSEKVEEEVKEEAEEEIKSWTVSFNIGEAAEAAGIAAPEATAVLDGETLAELPTVKWVGKNDRVVRDWYLEPELQNKYALETPINDNLTLFGKWEEQKPVSIEQKSMKADFINPDLPFITVSKTFSGIEKVPEGFYIELSTSGGDSYRLYPTAADPNYYSGEGLSWKWRIMNLTAGTYAVAEYNELKGLEDKYTVQTTGVGASVEVKAAELVFGTPYIETTCSHTDWPVSGGTFFAGSLTGNLGRGTVFLTEKSLSESERLTFIERVLPAFRAADSNVWKEPVYFFSIEQQSQTFTIAGKNITYNYENGVAIFDNTSMWQHVASCAFFKGDAASADITVTNTYTPNTADVTIKKVVSGTLGDYNRPFEIHVMGDADHKLPAGEGYTVGTDNSIVFDLKHNETLTIPNVPVGTTLSVWELGAKEAGYEVCYDGEPLGEGRTYYQVAVSKADEAITIIITNDKNEIPDTGISLDSLPYLIILAVAGAVFAVNLIKTSKDAYDD